MRDLQRQYRDIDQKAREIWPVQAILQPTFLVSDRLPDQLFASRSATAPLLEMQLAKIGNLQAQVRGTHLAAHIAQAAILKPEQIAQYDKLRGYHKKPQHESSHAGHQH